MNSKFREVFIDEECLDGFQTVDLNWDDNGICKRCGEPFTKKYAEQIFCSRKCVSLYETRMNDMEEKYGDAFTNWLNVSIDYSYSPEKF